MKRLVYTCVFGKYDWVFPPITPEDNVDYIIITDDVSMNISGWKTVLVDVSGFHNAKSVNLYYRALVHKFLPGYEYSLYIDGNIRLLGETSKFFNNFIESEAALGLFPHPLRSTVKQESAVCLEAGKVSESERLEEELSYYRNKGFPDKNGLIETTIILKNHNHPDLNRAMTLWWALFKRFGTRDQFSLPYVLWRTDVSRIYHEFSFREPNDYFGLYAHRADKRAPKYFAYIEGRSYDSYFYWFILKSWQFTWKVRRLLRSGR